MFEDSIAEVNAIWQQQQALVGKMADVVATFQDNAKHVEALVAEREAKLAAAAAGEASRGEGDHPARGAHESQACFDEVG